MGSVSEAKYTYWHTIVDLAEASEMPKAEWCRKNCISIKTFNHYEGIFRRQEARKVSYNKEDSDSRLIEDVDGTDKSASLRTSNYRQADGIEESVISVSNEADTTDQDGGLTDAKDHMNLPVSGETTGEDKARYFEVPMPGRKGGRKAYISKEGAKKKTKEERSDEDKKTGIGADESRPGLKSKGRLSHAPKKEAGANKQDEFMSHSSDSPDLCTSNEAFTIEGNGFKLVVGSGVSGDVLKNILKAVQDNA